MAETYTVARILAKVRTLLDDTVEPYFVSDANLLIFLDDRQRELAERTLCLRRGRFDPIAVAADDPWVPAQPGTIKPRTAVSRADGRELKFTTVNQIADLLYEESSDYGNLLFSNWRNATGTPEYVVTDMDETFWRLVPIPTAADTLDLEGYALPDVIDSADCDVTVPDRWAQGLYMGVLADAFSIEDADSIYDPKKANEWLAKWERFLADQTSRDNRDRRGGGRPVRYGGY